MKQFLFRHRRNALLMALRPGILLSLFMYAVIRTLFYEFPMTWTEELLFFLKSFLLSCFLIVTATAGSAWLYSTLRLIKKG